MRHFVRHSAAPLAQIPHRDGRIRTADPRHPKAVRYQAAPRPEAARVAHRPPMRRSGERPRARGRPPRPRRRWPPSRPSPGAARPRRSAPPPPPRPPRPASPAQSRTAPERPVIPHHKSDLTLSHTADGGTPRDGSCGTLCGRSGRSLRTRRWAPSCTVGAPRLGGAGRGETASPIWDRPCHYTGKVPPGAASMPDASSGLEGPGPRWAVPAGPLPTAGLPLLWAPPRAGACPRP